MIVVPVAAVAIVVVLHEKVPVAGVPPAPSAELIVSEQVCAKVGVEPCW